MLRSRSRATYHAVFMTLKYFQVVDGCHTLQHSQCACWTMQPFNKHSLLGLMYRVTQQRWHVWKASLPGTVTIRVLEVSSTARNPRVRKPLCLSVAPYDVCRGGRGLVVGARCEPSSNLMAMLPDIGGLLERSFEGVRRLLYDANDVRK